MMASVTQSLAPMVAAAASAESRTAPRPLAWRNSTTWGAVRRRPARLVTARVHFSHRGTLRVRATAGERDAEGSEVADDGEVRTRPSL